MELDVEVERKGKETTKPPDHGIVLRSFHLTRLATHSLSMHSSKISLQFGLLLHTQKQRDANEMTGAPVPLFSMKTT